METAESKVQIANNRLDEMAGKIQEALLPALASLAPAIEGAANLLGDFAQSDFVQTVLHGAGYVEGKKQEKALSASIEATNYKGLLTAWEAANTDKNLVLGGVGVSPLEVALNQERAAPVIETGKKKLSNLSGAIQEYYAKIQSDRDAAYGAGSGSNVNEDASMEAILAKKHKEGTLSDAGERYLADKETLRQMQDSQKNLYLAIDGLTKAIANGTLQVRVTALPPAPPKTDKVAAPAEAPLDH
jgi:hypothetical protein